MKTEITFALLAVLIAVPVNYIVDTAIVLFFYHLHPDNEWYAENYNKLPKFLHIFG